MTNPISPTSLVLVAILPSPRDMEIARLLGWYRIPLRFAPKIVDVDFLAFYQPASFGEGHRWKIESYCEVYGHELTTRTELFRDEPEHPHAKDEYYKIQIGALQALPTAIEAEDWKRFTFLYTTGQHLMDASSLHDLTVRDEERAVLWKALREHQTKGEGYQPDHNELILDPELLPFINGLACGLSQETEFEPNEPNLGMDMS